ncbi:hypothetical protein HYDPIDRAFT_110173 [Hydnomerulius pinastri MD-312]|nr:hypothetical protein HYDPIDRAFT_110173 [Hydnomerulius pinastri MD-312]
MGTLAVSHPVDAPKIHTDEGHRLQKRKIVMTLALLFYLIFVLMANTIPIPISEMPSDEPMALGYAFSILLYGVLIVQMFIYQTRFSRDSVWIRAYVWAVFMLETASVGLVLYSLDIGAKVHCLVCVALGLFEPYYWAVSIIYILTGIISVMVHGFYCWRIFVMARSWYIPVFVMLTSVAQCVFLNLGSMGYSMLFGLNLRSDLWMIGSFVCDLVITIETIRLLFRQGGKSTFKETRGLVMKLIKLTLETGAVTTAAMLFLFVLTWYDEARLPTFAKGHITPESTYNELYIFYSISRLYANCLLATLNARLVISNDRVEVHQVSTILFDVPLRTLASEHPTENHVNVTITQSHLAMGSFTTRDDSADSIADGSTAAFASDPEKELSRL